jgi:CheY-like chemotaxis protein
LRAGDQSILLVDADHANVELTMLAFGEAELGSSLRVARSADEAIEVLFADASYRPSLVLLDLRLPDPGAAEVLEQIKRDWRTSSIPVVVLASGHGVLDELDAAGLGVAGSLVKPVDLDEFIDAASAFSLYWRSWSSTREREVR